MFCLTRSRRVTPRRETRRLDGDVGGSWRPFEAARRRVSHVSVVGDRQQIAAECGGRDDRPGDGNTVWGSRVVVAGSGGVVGRLGAVGIIVVYPVVGMMAFGLVRHRARHGRLRAVVMGNREGVLGCVRRADVHRAGPRQREHDA